MAVERRFAGHAAGDAERGLKKPCVTGPVLPMLPRQLVGLFHLREDLRFAEDHAVEAGGDAEQVADDLPRLRAITSCPRTSSIGTL